MNSQERRMMNLALPSVVCGSTATLCGQRGRNKACKCPWCGYAIQTTCLKEKSKLLLYAYIGK